MTARIPLWYRGVVVGHTLVSECDYAMLAMHRWRPSSRGYVVRGASIGRGVCREISMHRTILGLEYGDPRQGDHANRNKLDNRRENLRIVTPAENSHNVPGRPNRTSKYRGVRWSRGQRDWIASAVQNGRKVHLGCFDSEVEAAIAAIEWRQANLPFNVIENDPIPPGYRVSAGKR